MQMRKNILPGRLVHCFHGCVERVALKREKFFPEIEKREFEREVWKDGLLGGGEAISRHGTQLSEAVRRKNSTFGLRPEDCLL